MKHIYVSPHSDDVALSCGGQIISDDHREKTLILNIFTSESPAADNESGRMESTFLDSINASRTMEDRAALDSLGIEARYTRLPEALLRGKFPFAILPRRDDSDLIDKLSDVLISYVKSFPDADFYFPAGIGNHIDHLACSKAAFRLLDDNSLKRFFLYEDIPYCWLKFIRDRYYKSLFRTMNIEAEDKDKAFRQDGYTLPGYMRRTMVPFPRGKALFSLVYISLLAGNVLHLPGSRKVYRGKMRLNKLSTELMEKKKRLLYHYASQMPMLFGADADEFLRRHSDSFSTEVTIEVSKMPPR